MTQEHIILTEEVQQDGQLVTIERETLKTTAETPEQAQTKQAYGIGHPDYVTAADRVYVYDEELGMSRSEPADVVEPVEPGASEPETEDEADEELEDEEEDLEDDDSEEEVCNHPVGNGQCVLESGHSGSHRLTL